MGVGITYMGTKRALAPIVGEVVRSAQLGTVLDAFSGMCSVGEAVGTTRQVWNNDVQRFASNVAKALFTSRDLPLSPVSCGDVHFAHFQTQRQSLAHSFEKSLELEERLILARSFSSFERTLKTLKKTIAMDASSCRLRSPHLFATTYAGSYFGIRQAIDADAIVAALQRAFARKRTSRDEVRWCIVALGRALLKISNSTGHFAQHLTPKPTSYQRYLALRRRELWSEWLTSLAEMTPVGGVEWRKSNRVFNQDCLQLIPRLSRDSTNIGVIYADPPYTDDQYSRFYHLLETLCLYDYPIVSGAGLYRPGRFHTAFSLKAKAAHALQRLIESSARTGADLILSYPTNGLATKAGANVHAMLRNEFRRVEVCGTITHSHSTFGASKGIAQSSATELIYLARSA